MAAATFDPSTGQLNIDFREGARTADFVEAISAAGESAHLARAVFPVDGISAGATAEAVEASLRSLPGVRSAVADPLTRSLLVRYLPAVVTTDDIRSAAASTGVVASHPETRADARERRRRMVRGSALAAALSAVAAIVGSAVAAPILLADYRWSLPVLSTAAAEMVLAALLVFQLLVPARVWLTASLRPWIRRVPDSEGLHALALLAAALTAFGASALVALQRLPPSGALSYYLAAQWVAAFSLFSRWLLRRLPGLPSEIVIRPREADRTSRILAVASAAAGVVAFVTWFVFGWPGSEIHAGSALAGALAASCVSAAAIVASSSLGDALRRLAAEGIEVRTPQAIRRLATVDLLAFDMRGTLTRGELQISDSVLLGGLGQKELLRIAAALSVGSPEAVLARVAAHEPKPWPVVAERDEQHGGVVGLVDGVRAHFGRADWLESKGVSTKPLADELERFAAEGKVVRILALDRAVRGALAIRDEIAEEAIRTVGALEELGTPVHVFAAEEERAVAAIAGRLLARGLSADLTPDAFRSRISAFRREGRRVALIASGARNRAATGAEATVALSGPADADIIIGEGGLASLPKAIAIARWHVSATRRAQRFAFAFHLVALPIAALVPLPGWPAVAAAASTAALSWTLWRTCRTLGAIS